MEGSVLPESADVRTAALTRGWEGKKPQLPAWAACKRGQPGKGPQVTRVVQVTHTAPGQA